MVTKKWLWPNSFHSPFLSAVDGDDDYDGDDDVNA